MKQVIDFYKCNSSPVYVCYLDLSKAFELVDHSILFDNLLKRNLPDIIVCIFRNWYFSQTFVIQWSNVLSRSFNVSNGVRQGGIISPIFFNVFIDGLSEDLRNLQYGCFINTECFNLCWWYCIVKPITSCITKTCQCLCRLHEES